MATEVSSVARILYREEEEEKGRDLITRDFLGGCALDLELSISSSSQREISNGLMDLNMPATSTAPFLSPAASCVPSVCTIEKVKSALERVARESQQGKRESQSKRHEMSCDRSASASPSPSPSPSSTSSITYSPIKRRGAAASAAEEATAVAERSDGCDWSSGGGGGGALIAAACSNCLLYVLISKEIPRCPRCDSHVPAPAPVLKKKARIDLNTTRNYF